MSHGDYFRANWQNSVCFFLFVTVYAIHYHSQLKWIDTLNEQPQIYSVGIVSNLMKIMEFAHEPFPASLIQCDCRKGCLDRYNAIYQRVPMSEKWKTPAWINVNANRAPSPIETNKNPFKKQALDPSEATRLPSAIERVITRMEFVLIARIILHNKCHK